MKLLGSAKKDVDSNKNGEIIPKLETVEVVLVHCNLVKNYYQHSSKLLFSTINTEFSHIEVWFTDQSSKPLEMEDNVNLMLIIG